MITSFLAFDKFQILSGGNMNNYLKTFFMISFLLFIFTVNGVAQETSNNNASPLDQRLLKAVRDGRDLEHVESILQLGPDINATDELGRTAAMLAFSRRDADVLGLLMDRGADVYVVDKTSHLCLDYILNVHVENFDQERGQSFINIDLRQEENTNKVRLELSFSLQQLSHLTPPLPPIVGVGESSISYEERRPSPSRFRESEEGGEEGKLSEVVRKAVRDGYKQLDEALRDRALILQQPQLVSTIATRAGNNILIPLGWSHLVQEGDVFGIYSRTNAVVFAASGNCHNPFGPPLNTAIAVRVYEDSAMLAIQGEDRGIQPGDTVALFSGIDFDFYSRQQDRETERLLRVNPMPHTFVQFSVSYPDWSQRVFFWKMLTIMFIITWLKKLLILIFNRFQ